jgi:hypothetical protein
MHAQFSADANFSYTVFVDETQFSSSDFADASLPSRSVFASALQPPSEKALKGAVYRDEQPESSQVSRPAP